jgi:predicted DNA-binding antitoxin AbrB/MazE fold protein
MKTIHAVYEQGIFRPHESVELPERTEVEFEPRPAAKQSNGEKNGLEEIYEILSERYETGDSTLAARHNEHQP